VTGQARAKPRGSICAKPRLVDLASTAVARYPADDAPLLLEALCRAEIVPTVRMPTEVVAMNSYVEFCDERIGAVRHVRLVYPYQANISQGQLSVLSLIGTALIGLTGGESIACQI
jgi:regulator of nucleoside diphosphate kinase